MNPQQSDVDNSVLLILYEESNARGHKLTADQIAIKMFGRVGHERILMSLEHLAKEGFAENDGHWGRVAGYKITRAGVEQIERRFEVRHDGANTSYSERLQAIAERGEPTGSPVSQAKLDLAVLYKLHQHAEAGGEAVTPADLLRLFDIHISIRRVELALKALESKQDVERAHHDYSADGGFWQISRDGMLTVDRAIRAPTTFIGRLHANGDAWLETDEAKQAVLKKLPSSPSATVAVSAPQETYFAPPKPQTGTDWAKWAAIAAWIIIPVTIVGILVAVWLDKN